MSKGNINDIIGDIKKRLAAEDQKKCSSTELKKIKGPISEKIMVKPNRINKLIAEYIVRYESVMNSGPKNSKLTKSQKALVNDLKKTAGRSTAIIVDAKEQKLYLLEDRKLVLTAIVSTGYSGNGNLEGTGKTPLGLHLIYGKYGDKAKPGTIFKARVDTGVRAKIFTEPVDIKKDYVTTRIMWLKGLENGYNRGKNKDKKLVDSKKRYIYIHGTPEEGLLGTPASHGCVRMKNSDVITLYNLVAEGTPVYITD